MPFTLFDNRVREEESAKGATLDTSTGKQTQWYDDGYRFTSSPSDSGHWTNQNVEPGDPGRHEAPPDVKK